MGPGPQADAGLESFLNGPPGPGSFHLGSPAPPKDDPHGGTPGELTGFNQTSVSEFPLKDSGHGTYWWGQLLPVSQGRLRTRRRVLVQRLKNKMQCFPPRVSPASAQGKGERSPQPPRSFSLPPSNFSQKEWPCLQLMLGMSLPHLQKAEKR